MSGILILGKRQGTKRVNHHLHGRVAIAAALWHSWSERRLPIFYLAADTHGPARSHDALVVRSLLTERYRVPAEVVHVRRWSLCTLVEVRGMRVLSRRHRLRDVLAVTHGYHARRAGAYLTEAGLTAELRLPDVSALDALAMPAGLDDVWQEIRRALERARPRRLDLTRERAIEAVATLVHRLDPRGRLERRLAQLVRA